MNTLLPSIWTWDNGTLTTRVFVEVLTAILISVLSLQLIEEVSSGRYGVDINVSLSLTIYISCLLTLSID